MKKVLPCASPNCAFEREDRTRPTYRFSGHETFPFRYSWLPKAVVELTANAELFSDDERAMVRLGVGKNMLKAIRFWVQAAGIIKDGKSKPCSEWEPRACVRSSLLPASSFLYHSRLCTKATLACKAQCHGCSALGTQTSSLANFGQVGQHSAANFRAQSTLIGLMKVQVRFGLVRAVMLRRGIRPWMGSSRHVCILRQARLS
jgi:hypothetical protein